VIRHGSDGRETFERYGRRRSATWALEARVALGRATGEESQREEARRGVDALVARAPAACPETMAANVRLHRDVVE
jgi:hypothetical protein